MRRIVLIAVCATLGVVGCNTQEAVVSGKDNKVLTLTAPRTVTLHAGETAQVKLGVTRKEFDAPVTIDFSQLPPGVTVVETDHVIPKGVKEATFTLKAADNATGKGHVVKLSASSDGMKDGPIDVTLDIAEKRAGTPNPPKEEVLVLNVPKKVTIHPNDIAPVKISLTRKNFDGPVTIEFAQVPSGVTVTESDRVIPQGATEATFNLKAAANATGQGHAIKVSATGDNMKAGPVEFILDVTEKKALNLEEKRKELEQSTRASLEEVNKHIANLEARAKDAKGPAKEEADAALVKLRQSRDDLEKRLQQAGATSEAAWDNFSNGVRSAALDLQTASKQAWDKVKK